MEKPLGKGTPNRAGYCNRQPSTKQQRVVIGSARLPSRKRPQGPPLPRRGKSTEAVGQQGVERVQPSEQSGKETVSMCEGKQEQKCLFLRSLLFSWSLLKGLGR